MSRPEDLKLRARELFAPAFAASVIEKIELDEKAAVAKRSHDAQPSVAAGRVEPESIATLWLGDELYAKLGTGTFTGCPTVRWNGIFEDGRDEFIFLPEAAKPFTYTTSAKLGSKTVKPRLMLTDGGSIPLILWGLSNFSPWGYAPGYMVHDWLFVAHRCKFAPDNVWNFNQSATILAECIKTLMEVGFTDYDGTTKKLGKAIDTLYLIHHAVSSGIAEGYWNDPRPLDCRT